MFVKGVGVVVVSRVYFKYGLISIFSFSFASLEIKQPALIFFRTSSCSLGWGMIQSFFKRNCKSFLLTHLANRYIMHDLCLMYL